MRRKVAGLDLAQNAAYMQGYLCRVATARGRARCARDVCHSVFKDARLNPEEGCAGGGGGGGGGGG